MSPLDVAWSLLKADPRFRMEGPTGLGGTVHPAIAALIARREQSRDKGGKVRRRRGIRERIPTTKPFQYPPEALGIEEIAAELPNLGLPDPNITVGRKPTARDRNPLRYQGQDPSTVIQNYPEASRPEGVEEPNLLMPHYNPTTRRDYETQQAAAGEPYRQGPPGWPAVSAKRQWPFRSDRE